MLDKPMAIQYQKLDAPRKWCAAVMHLIKTGLHMASATEALNNLGADAPQRLAKDSKDLLHLTEAATTRKEYRDAFEAVDQMLLDAPTEHMDEQPECEIYNVPVKLFEHFFHLVTYEDCVAHQSQCFKEDLEKDTGMRSLPGIGFDLAQEVTNGNAIFNVTNEWKAGLPSEGDIEPVMEKASKTIRNLSPKAMSNVLKQVSQADPAAHGALEKYAEFHQKHSKLVGSAGPVASVQELEEAIQETQKQVTTWAVVRIEAMLVSALAKPAASQKKLIRQHWLEISVGKHGISEDDLQPILASTCKERLG
eukprot:s1635_g10.t1